MRKVFIDLGGYDGDSLRAFLLGEMVSDPVGYDLYVFEPNPRYKDNCERLANRYHAKFLPLAAWVEDKEMDFAVEIGRDCDLGATLMKTKKDIWEHAKTVKVQAIDFDKWIRQFEGCQVVLKMDIEGAEFPLLEKMLQTGTVKIITKLFVEFHANKLPEYTSTYREELRARLNQVTEVNDWH